MKKDKLKEFISEHREEFDFGMPSEKVWKGIEKQVTPKEKTRWMIPAVAASACFILVSAFLFLNKTETEIQDEVLTQNEESPQNIISNELAEIEEYYAVQVDLKVTEAKKYEESEELLEEVDLLKEEFLTLKKEMGQGANSGELLEAMIENYKLRLGLLEDLLKEYEQDKTDSHEKNI